MYKTQAPSFIWLYIKVSFYNEKNKRSSHGIAKNHYFYIRSGLQQSLTHSVISSRRDTSFSAFCYSVKRVYFILFKCILIRVVKIFHLKTSTFQIRKKKRTNNVALAPPHTSKNRFSSLLTVQDSGEMDDSRQHRQ